MNSLESDLRRLPEPAPPEGLAAGIVARIALLEAEREAGAVEPPRVAGARVRRDRLGWAVALVGVVVGIGAQAYMLIVGEATLDFTSPRTTGGMDGVVEMLPASPAVAVLAAGLLLYLAGLFAPLRGAGHS